MNRHVNAISGRLSLRKPWRYAIIRHDVIAENMTLESLVRNSQQ